jgi:hypothetical protein
MEERPEKCPIETCEYHTKGFARKYDKNRHALTHYKGTMVCPFCPGPGTPYEKAFNRADVFKRHLTAVHNVEQTPPNSRKLVLSTGGGSRGNGEPGSGGRPGATCSICHSQFQTAQEFYEHLDDCVLNVIVPTTPKTADTAASNKTPTTAGTDKGKEVEVEQGNAKTGAQATREVGGGATEEHDVHREEDRPPEKDSRGTEESDHKQQDDKTILAASNEARSPEPKDPDTARRDEEGAEPPVESNAEITLGSPSGPDAMDTGP